MSGTPRQFSAYLITWSDEPSMPVGQTIIDKGARRERDWELMHFDTNKMTSATGRRIARLCPYCRVLHGRVGMLGHDGECGSEDVKAEAVAELRHAARRAEVSRG